MHFCIALIFLLIALFGDFPRTLFFLVLRALWVPICLFAMVVFVTGIITNRYNAVLSREGIEFGSFYGKQRYKWSQIKATGVIRPVTGKRVFIELTQPGQSQTGSRLRLRYLPDNYGMDAEELAKTILRWVREYGAAHN
jgi:hypothetical protein